LSEATTGTGIRGDSRPGEPLPEQPPKLRAIAEFLVVAVCITSFLLLVTGTFVVLLRPNAAGSRDFVEYWAAGQQLMHHANPYDAGALLDLERSVGYPRDLGAQIMANPPYALPLVMPFGLLGPTAGLIFWVILLIFSLAASVQMIRKMHGAQKSQLHLLSYAFAPALSCVLAGQVTIFILLGLVLFLRLHLSRPFWAGASLWLCLLKPHLFLPFGVVLLAWIAITRSYRVIAGCATALGLSSAIATLVSPSIWREYSQMMGTARVDHMPQPCLSVLLKQWVYPHTFWLQCVPAALACIWAFNYYLQRRERWNWLENGSLLVLVSLLMAPYSWFMDQAILLAALLHGAYHTRSRALVSILALMSAAIQIAMLRGATLISPFYLWTAPAWLVWYLIARRMQHELNPSGE
jgi:hypothetical protein